jgi:hypothetical protein
MPLLVSNPSLHLNSASSWVWSDMIYRVKSLWWNIYRAIDGGIEVEFLSENILFYCWRHPVWFCGPLCLVPKATWDLLLRIKQPKHETDKSVTPSNMKANSHFVSPDREAVWLCFVSQHGSESV